MTRFFCLSKQDSIEELTKIKKGWYGKIKPLSVMLKELVLDRESPENLNENAVMKFDEVKDAITSVEADVTIIFDKGASSMVLTAGVGGRFFDLGNETQHLSFQPLAQIDNDKERQWVQEWLCDFIRQENVKITPEHKKLIWNALNVVASYKEKSFRRMTNLVNAIQSVELKTALQPLTISGAYGEIFDADEDSLQLSSWQAFEMECDLFNSEKLLRQ